MSDEGQGSFLRIFALKFSRFLISNLKNDG